MDKMIYYVQRPLNGQHSNSKVKKKGGKIHLILCDFGRLQMTLRFEYIQTSSLWFWIDLQLLSFSTKQTASGLHVPHLQVLLRSIVFPPKMICPKDQNYPSLYKTMLLNGCKTSGKTQIDYFIYLFLSLIYFIYFYLLFIFLFNQILI